MSEPRRIASPPPTQAQLDDLYNRLTPLRVRYPGWSDSQIAGTPEASRLIFEWRREHRLLPLQQSRY
jgi:hypothetical protein